MKILMLPYIKERKYHLISNAIEEILTDARYVVDTELKQNVKYDCIILLNKKQLHTLKKNKELEGIPVVYMFCISDTATESIVQPSESDFTFILRDRMINVSLPLYEHSMFLYMLNHQLSLRKDNDRKHTKNRKKIYVDIDQQLGVQTLQNLIGFFNLIDFYDINVFSENISYKHFFNKHLSIVKDRLEINKYIDESDVIIASGYSAMQGVLLGKKVIIVGERGYGGVVTSTNISDHYQNNFQGRNGGQLGEYIPTNLLQRDIEFEPEGYDREKVQRQLSQMIEIQQKKLLKKIEEVVNLSKLMKKDISSIKFRMNVDFMLSKGKGYWFNFTNKNLYNIYKRFNESECVILLDFKDPKKIDDILNKYPIEYKDDIYEFIISLIHKKYILPIEIDHTSLPE